MQSQDLINNTVTYGPLQKDLEWLRDSIQSKKARLVSIVSRDSNRSQVKKLKQYIRKLHLQSQNGKKLKSTKSCQLLIRQEHEKHGKEIERWKDVDEENKRKVPIDQQGEKTCEKIVQWNLSKKEYDQIWRINKNNYQLLSPSERSRIVYLVNQIQDGANEIISENLDKFKNRQKKNKKTNSNYVRQRTSEILMDVEQQEPEDIQNSSNNILNSDYQDKVQKRYYLNEYEVKSNCGCFKDFNKSEQCQRNIFTDKESYLGNKIQYYLEDDESQDFLGIKNEQIQIKQQNNNFKKMGGNIKAINQLKLSQNTNCLLRPGQNYNNVSLSGPRLN